MAPVVVNRNLHSDDSDRYCMHIELDISESRYFKFISFCLNS
jgi:sulfite reductase alpha subunit-like flavoprotein